MACKYTGRVKENTYKDLRLNKHNKLTLNPGT
jgi:hypothetical protein